MKMLMFHVSDFWYRSYERNLESEAGPPEPEDTEEGAMPDGGVLAWVQVETPDLDREDEVIRKAIKNLKWHARKVDETRITLHSFAHLSEDRADPERASALLHRIGERLESVGFEVTHTPWGYFNEFRMHVNGPSMAKVFRSF